MLPVARLSAAIEVLADIFRTHRPASEALKDWGKSHRFAGSSDRAGIGNLVYDVLRRKGSLAWLMQSEEPRALVLALYAYFWADMAALEKLCTGENHAPAPLSAKERSNLARAFADAPPHVRGFYLEWLDSRLTAVYGEVRIEEGAALAERAPVDLRVNTLRTMREKALASLEHYKAIPCQYSPFGIRVPYGAKDARSPHIEAEGIYQRGHVELQDEGSQIAAILTGAQAGEQILDLCAGGGGKTLALSALMQNKGQIIATDSDKHRLAPIYERLKRAGAHNVQVRPPDQLEEFVSRMDRVVLDVPCTGSGAWRRRPDNKWRLKEQNILDRQKEQDHILQRGAAFVRPGGGLTYITCSILKEENENRIAAFLKTDAGNLFRVLAVEEVWAKHFAQALPPQPSGVRDLKRGLRLSPHSSATDGFFVACLEKKV